MTRIGFAAVMTAFILASACDKKDDASTGAAPSAQAAPSGSGPEWRRDRGEHEGDAGRDRDHPPR
jgi:hypothetical protein